MPHSQAPKPASPGIPPEDSGLEKDIRKDISTLLTRGEVTDRSIHDVRSLSFVSRFLSDLPTDAERITETLTAAINQFKEQPRRDALMYWLGLTPDPRAGEPNYFAARAAYERINAALPKNKTITYEHFRTNVRKEMCSYLARQTFQAYWIKTNLG